MKIFLGNEQVTFVKCCANLQALQKQRVKEHCPLQSQIPGEMLDSTTFLLGSPLRIARLHIITIFMLSFFNSKWTPRTAIQVEA